MTVKASPNLSRTRQAVFGDLPDVLAEIYREDVNMAVWRRSVGAKLIAEVQALSQKKGISSHRTIISVANTPNVEEALPHLAAYPHLQKDIGFLVDMFGCLFKLNMIGLRIATPTRAMCPRFHVDRIPCRLITTYLGTGTDWLPHQSANRSKLGAGNGGLSDEESGLYPSGNHIETLLPGDVALLKGELWEGNEGAGMVHRSPSMNLDEHRLLISFDFLSPANP
jgi:hypothetical protein